MSTEEWRDIPGWEGYYQASSEGRVRSVDRMIVRSDGRTCRWKGTELKPAMQESGHLFVTLCRGSGTKIERVHRVVCLTFIGPCPPGMEVCHNNGKPDDNRLDNLRYGTKSENRRDDVSNGAHANARKTHCPRGHELSDVNNTSSAANRGYRNCLACNRARGFLKRKPGPDPEFKAVSDSYYEKIMRGLN